MKYTFRFVAKSQLTLDTKREYSPLECGNTEANNVIVQFNG